MARYKVYEAKPDNELYDGVTLFGAKNADDANTCIMHFNFDSIKDGYTLCPVDEQDIIEDVYTHRHGLLSTRVIYVGW